MASFATNLAKDAASYFSKGFGSLGTETITHGFKQMEKYGSTVGPVIRDMVESKWTDLWKTEAGKAMVALRPIAASAGLDNATHQKWERVLQTQARKEASEAIFGKGDKYLQAAYDAAELAGGDKQMLMRAVDAYVGRRTGVGNSGALEGLVQRPWERMASDIEVFSKLSLSAASQISQFSHPTIVAGFGPSVKAIGSIFANSANAERSALESMAIASGAKHSFYEEFLGGAARAEERGRLASLIAQPLIATDKWMRILANETGRFFAEDLFQNVVQGKGSARAAEKLKSLGIDVSVALKNGALSPDDLLIAGRRMSDKTMFLTNPGSLPPLWRDNAPARVLTMFKPYFYQQTKFIKDELVKPAIASALGKPFLGANPNWKPLARAAVLFPVMGEIQADLAHLIRKGSLKERPDAEKYTLDRFVENISRAGAFGLLSDIATSLSYGDLSITASMMLGPVGSDIAEAATFGIGKPFLNEPFKPGGTSDNLKEFLKRKGLASIPYVGPVLRTKYYPPKKEKTLESGGLTKLTKKVGQSFGGPSTLY